MCSAKHKKLCIFKKKGIELLGSFHSSVFNSDIGEQVEKKLYPNCIQSPISRFYKKFGHATIASNVVGSLLPGRNSRTSAVIMAYWPSRGQNLSDIDYSRMQVGVIEYFISHLLQYQEKSEEEHVFAYVKWKKGHPHCDWFGVSATVCIDSYEDQSCFSLLPIQ